MNVQTSQSVGGIVLRTTEQPAVHSYPCGRALSPLFPEDPGVARLSTELLRSAAKTSSRRRHGCAEPSSLGRSTASGFPTSTVPATSCRNYLSRTGVASSSRCASERRDPPPRADSRRNHSRREGLGVATRHGVSGVLPQATRTFSERYRGRGASPVLRRVDLCLGASGCCHSYFQRKEFLPLKAI